MKKILLIEDDPKIAEIERDYLEANDFAVSWLTDGKEGLTTALEGDWALILLDVMLPGMDGFQICREIRKRKEIPVLMVTARQEEIDILRGLGLGANDYIMKPFNPNELVARVRAHIQRYERIMEHSGQSSPIIRSGILEIQPDAYRVLVRGEEVNLTHREFEVLAFLAQNPNIVFSREALFEKIWRYDALGETATVMVHINRIREKIEPDPAHPVYLETVRGAGYRFRK